jgi:hypothetical protein
MKKQILIATLLIALLSNTGKLYAQDESSRKGYEYYRAVSCRISSTDNGAIVSFNYDVKSPRDAASGQASGKRQHKPFNFIVSASDNAVTETKKVITAPATSSDKVSYSDLSVMISLNKGSYMKIPIENGAFTLPPVKDEDCDMVCSWSWGATNSGSGRCSVGFALTFKDGVLMAINEQGVPTKKK